MSATSRIRPHRRRARPGTEPLALARQVAARDPALHRAGVPLARLRRPHVRRVLRDPLHGPVPKGHVRLQRRRAALDVAGRVLLLWRARHRPVPAVHARRGARLPRDARRRVPGAALAGLVLVKWWLLAIPHYLLVGIFVGSGSYAASKTDDWDDWHWGYGGGLVGLLVFFAGVALLFTTRYPCGIFDFVLGLDRWVARVIAYAGLMTDRYPPFRLDQGGTEVPGWRRPCPWPPGGRATPPTPPEGGGGAGHRAPRTRQPCGLAFERRLRLRARRDRPDATRR